MIKKFSLKIKNITPWLLTIVMVLGLLSFADKTQAYFSDDGTSQSTSFHAGTLEMTLNSGGDFDPQLTLDQTVIKNISVNKAGDLPFQYVIKTTNITGDVCGSITLKAELNGEEKYNGNISGFDIVPIEVSAQDNWVFTTTLNDDSLWAESKSCQFQFVFEAWQTNMTHYGDGGFTDEENIDNILQIGAWIPVLDPIGNQSGTEGELLEFTINAVDPNGDIVLYTYSNLPAGATFTPSTKTFSWTPSAGQKGTYPNIHFEVSDGQYVDSEDITIIIGEMLPPEITDVEATNITSSSANIVWNTNQVANSKVEYGTESSYGSLKESSDFVQSHQISLSELSAGTLYHYKVISKNSTDKETTSLDNNFTTNSS